MSTSHSCDPLCSFRYASEERSRLVVSSFPDLLSNAAGAPSDSQALEIHGEIERAERHISTLNMHIARLQGAMEDLVRHRAELEDFIKSHKAVVSAQRCLPNEILLEIFEHCVNPLASPEPRHNISWIISQVCSRWRALAISSPRLWCNFFFKNWVDIDINRRHSYLRRISAIQLARARHIPLSIRFTRERTVDILDLFLEVSAQWGDAALSLSPEGFSRIFNHGGKFLALKRLALSSWQRIPGTNDLRESFPVLEELRLALSNEAFPRNLLLPWTQLRKCALRDIHSRELLWIASQLSTGTQVSALWGANVDELGPTPPTNSLISALSLSECGDRFVGDVLNSLVAPALETLVITVETTNVDTQHIMHLLDHSACALKRLRIDTPIQDEDLVPLLESPHARGIVHLDLPNTLISTRGIAALASHLQLRTLVLKGCCSELEEPLLTALTKQRPIVLSGFPQEQDAAGELELILAP
ncbi:hypothetical protein K438DRAFT_1681880 [Mycena galopus ATCC 62051]|nr:hypothetical protein K438DRAFT_1681880 [Mycena galopus ATCC 62051]